MYDYQNKFNKFEFAREILALRYMITSMLINQNNIMYYLEGKEKAFYQILSEEGKQKVKRTIRFRDEIQFDMFKVSGRYYNALVNKFGVESVTNASIVLDDYLKENITKKQLSQSQINKLLRQYTEQYYSRQEVNDYLKKAIDITTKVDYKLIDNETIARQYIAGIPFYMRSLDEGVKYLKERFNINETKD